ncbi:MAG: DNA mismatch repair protein MutS [Candidatus Thorarchaeota archaeon]|nr:MAG: DNA mismatch repair protein MutS [Candidatus Thorarchaeota archaeon]
MKKHTPMQRQYLELKKQYKDCILLFRLGDFYEMFNEDAKKASETLEIVLTARGEGIDKWPMCGVPYHSIEGYIAKLLEAGYTVAIAEQVEDASKAKGLVKREVVRVITPGTILESSMLEDSSNNYLVAVIEHDQQVGIASVDVSTGEFVTTQFPGTLLGEKTINELGRLGPAELLLPESAMGSQSVMQAFEPLETKITFRSDLDFSARQSEQRLKEQFNVTTLDGFGLIEKEVAIGAAGAVLAYLHDVYKENVITLTGVRTYSVERHMIVDRTTQRNLELLKNARDGSKRGTLLSVLSKTVTPMGRRLLKKWILQPLMDIDEINERLDAVEEFARSAIDRQETMNSLSNLGDLERITSRVVFGTGGARDLVALRNALSRIPKIKKKLNSCKADLVYKLCSDIDPLEFLHETLEKALIDDPPVSIREGGMIKEGFSEDLDKLKQGISDDKKWIASLQVRERRRTGIKSLKVGFNKVFGYYIEVTKANIDNVPEEYERKQTLTNAERYIIPELKEKEASVLAGEEKINQLEYRIYEDLRALVKERVDALRKNADAIAKIDVLASLAEVAVLRKYHRPELTKGKRIKIIDGRHPSLEMMLGPNEFVPNSLEIGDGGATLLIVTGPNMAGKSTYMRQTAIIALLAQMGSFTPAKEAEIGLVDRIFTRVGAFDDLTARQSTFMVEMVETANILNNATERSLVILDEIGRGTSTFDGMALAWAVAEQIVQIKCRTLFATHFHQLTDMASSYHGVKNVHTLARETGNTIVFLHKVVEGGTDRSYGVHVASLAGVPNSVVRRAQQLLIKLEKESTLELGKGMEDAEEAIQTSLEALTIDDPIVERIKHLDLDRMTPVDALLKLKEMQEEAKKRS